MWCSVPAAAIFPRISLCLDSMLLHVCDRRVGIQCWAGFLSDAISRCLTYTRPAGEGSAPVDDTTRSTSSGVFRSLASLLMLLTLLCQLWTAFCHIGRYFNGVTSSYGGCRG